MIAVIETGGKQYTVLEGRKLLIEKLDVQAGEQVHFSKVLLLKNQSGEVQVGSPVVEGATVVARLVRQTRGEKVIVFKKKRRHNYRRKKGHKQDLSLVEVSHIGLPGEPLPSAQANVKAKPTLQGEKSVAKGDSASKKAPPISAPTASDKADKVVTKRTLKKVDSKPKKTSPSSQSGVSTKE